MGFNHDSALIKDGLGLYLECELNISVKEVMFLRSVCLSVCLLVCN